MVSKALLISLLIGVTLGGSLEFVLVSQPHYKALDLRIKELEEEIRIYQNQTTPERPYVVLRVDDIQDYTFRKGQLAIIEYSLAWDIPLTLGIIPNRFGEDADLVDAVSAAIEEGCEIAAHGWRHVDFTEYNLTEQARMLQLSRDKLREVLNVNVTIMLPPYYQFNSDTLLAMKQTGYNVISTSTEIGEVGPLSEGIVNIPATVELSVLINDTWHLKDLETIVLEIMQSVKRYGFAIIIVHPQELLDGDQLDQSKFDIFKKLISLLDETYTFKTINELYSSVVSH